MAARPIIPAVALAAASPEPVTVLTLPRRHRVGGPGRVRYLPDCVGFLTTPGAVRPNIPTIAHMFELVKDAVQACRAAVVEHHRAAERGDLPGMDDAALRIRSIMVYLCERLAGSPDRAVPGRDEAQVVDDPTFLMDNPRILQRYKNRPDDELRGRIIDEDDLIVDGRQVHITVTLAPELFRPEPQAGGNKDAEGKEIREFQISRENAGRISMLRNGREIYYDIVPRMLPAGVDKIDRYIGIQVTFPAELDEYFQVRNVKRGAEPVSKLREQMRTWLERPIRNARKEIRTYWRQVAVADQPENGSSTKTMEAIERAEKTAPKGQAGLGVTDEQQEQIINDLLQDLDIDPIEKPEQADKIRTQIRSHPMTLVDGSWPGKEMLEIDHLNGKAVVRLNHRHMFIRDIYDSVRAAASKSLEDQDAGELLDLIHRVSTGLDVLFLAYAKAENMHRDPEIFDDLRSYWGQHAQAYMKEVFKNEE